MPGRLAIDIGGTFIDAIEIDEGTGDVNLEKVPTTPDDPSQGVLDAIEKGDTSLPAIRTFVHGTTLGVNALIEREGARVGIITNEGFRDVFELGRYDVPDEDIYNFTYDKPETLVPRRRRIGVPGRIDVNGEVVTPLDDSAVVDAATRLLEDHDVESIAICFLHAYRNPDHEERASKLLEDAYPDLSVSISSDIVREHYEYERTSTTVLDAYIKPIFESYVGTLEDGLTEGGFDGSLLITRSGGGALPASSATEAPVHTVLSGPAGGIIGAGRIASMTPHENLITMDMGGTSLETCVINDGSPSVTYESSLEHLPMQIPVFDIRTIGAGGGSIAWHEGNLLKVGPKSAGSDPGPICYGRDGRDPTVTDAAVELGYIHKDAFLGGEMELAVNRVQNGIEEKVANPLGLSVPEASKGIFDVTVNKQVGAIREITIEKGVDPRDFSLLAFGGAGPMIAPLVGRELGVEQIVIPEVPSVFSAWGMLMADVVHDFSRTYLTTVDDPDVTLTAIEDDFQDLEREARSTLEDEGYPVEEQNLVRSIEMRYRGQAHTVEIDGHDLESLSDIDERFVARHAKQYGHNLEDPAEVVYLRVRGIGLNDKPSIGRHESTSDGDANPSSSRTIYCFSEETDVTADVYDRATLAPGTTIRGPAIIQEPTATTVFHSNQHATVDEYGHIVIENGGDHA